MDCGDIAAYFGRFGVEWCINDSDATLVGGPATDDLDCLGDWCAKGGAEATGRPTRPAVLTEAGALGIWLRGTTEGSGM